MLCIENLWRYFMNKNDVIEKLKKELPEDYDFDIEDYNIEGTATDGIAIRFNGVIKENH